MTKNNKTIKKLAIDKDKITQFCQKNHICQFSFFGSILRDDFGDNSDVDVLVEFHNQASVGLFELYDMEQELSNLFGGRKVDINTKNSLSKYFHSKVIKEMDIQYDKTR